jgi:hypothetical protein
MFSTLKCNKVLTVYIVDLKTKAIITKDVHFKIIYVDLFYGIQLFL